MWVSAYWPGVHSEQPSTLLRMKSFLSILAVLLTQFVWAQSVSFNTIVASVLEQPVSNDQAPGDTLRAKRRLFTTDIYRQQEKLSPAAIDALFAPAPQAANTFRWAKRLKPVGSLVSLAGLVVGYIGIKGTQATATVRGKRTPSNPSPPDVEVTYTNRRLPVVLGGLGLLIGGICLIEVANEGIHRSVTLFNASAGPQRSFSSIKVVKFGLTNSNRLGLVAQL